MRDQSLNSTKWQQSQRGPKATRVALLMAFLLVLPLGGAQNGPTSHIPGLPQAGGQGDSPLDDNNVGPNDAELARRIRMLNAERQKSLVADTVKLLKLANELNAVMAKEDASVPSQAELRKLADIEKLAHNVKEKMEITVNGTPNYRRPGMPSIP
jgi:hypothetical protein